MGTVPIHPSLADGNYSSPSIVPDLSAPTVLVLIHLGIFLLTSLFAFLADIHGDGSCVHQCVAVIEEMEAVCLVEGVDLSAELDLVIVELAHVCICLVCSIQRILNVVNLSFQFNYFLNLCCQGLFNVLKSYFESFEFT